MVVGVGGPGTLAFWDAVLCPSKPQWPPEESHDVGGSGAYPSRLPNGPLPPPMWKVQGTPGNQPKEGTNHHAISRRLASFPPA